MGYGDSRGMSERFRAVDQETPYLLPPSVQDWLSEPHLARFVVDVVSKPMLQHHCQVLIVCLHVLYGYDEQYKLEKLPELGELIRKVSGIEIARNKPILGSRNLHPLTGRVDGGRSSPRSEGVENRHRFSAHSVARPVATERVSTAS